MFRNGDRSPSADTIEDFSVIKIIVKLSMSPNNGTQLCVFVQVRLVLRNIQEQPHILRLETEFADGVDDTCSIWGDKWT